MKTKTETHQLKVKKSSGLENRNENINEEKPKQEVKPSLPKIDLELRRNNRALPINKVLEVLQGEAPTFWQMAEVVGKWVWIQFKEKQPREVTMILSQLGFHWNNKRQAWQHPCGNFTQKPASYDPRERYGSAFPADSQAA
jgi:hypothetical protein